MKKYQLNAVFEDDTVVTFGEFDYEYEIDAINDCYFLLKTDDRFDFDYSFSDDDGITYSGKHFSHIEALEVQ